MLRPLKAKTLLPETAAKTGLPEDVVKDIVIYYWQEIRASLSALKHNRVQMSNLGTFKIKEWKVDDKIAQIESFETANKLKGLQLINARFRTAESLYDLQKLKKLIKEESQKAEFIRLHKKTVNETKQHHTDMESEGSDPGGSEE